jgi:hypothetical protein
VSEEELREALGDLGFGRAAVVAAQEMVGQVASNSHGVTLHDFLLFIRRVRAHPRLWGSRLLTHEIILSSSSSCTGALVLAPCCGMKCMPFYRLCCLVWLKCRRWDDGHLFAAKGSLVMTTNSRLTIWAALL